MTAAPSFELRPLSGPSDVVRRHVTVRMPEAKKDHLEAYALWAGRLEEKTLTMQDVVEGLIDDLLKRFPMAALRE